MAEEQDAEIVRYPERLKDEHGQDMWDKIMNLLAKVRVSIDRCQKAHRKGTVAAQMISSNECTGAQRIDESGAPSARIPGWGFEAAPTLGPPIKGTAAEDAQSCTSARTIRLLINAVWKIQRDGGATSALA